MASDYNDFTTSNENKIRPDLIKSGTAKIGAVTLQDCLACSGCVTSAETILIQQHSADEVLKLFEHAKETPIVVAISPQCVSSVTEWYKRTKGDTEDL